MKEKKKTVAKKERYVIGEEYNPNRRHFLSRAFIAVGKKLVGKTIGVTYSAPLPEEPCIICANHSREYGPLALIATAKRETRIWSIVNSLKLKGSAKFAMKDIYPSKKGFSYVLHYLFVLLVCVPLINLIKAQEPIPVYPGKGLEKTMERSIFTLKEGKDVAIFVENAQPHEDYKYVNQIGRGFAYLVKCVKEELKKPVWVVPAYVCKSLKRVCYGTPILAGGEDNFIEKFKDESKRLVAYVMDEIERLGNSLPKHKITNYNDTPRVRA